MNDIYYEQLLKKYPQYSGKIIGAGESPSITKQIEDLWKFLTHAEKQKFLINHINKPLTI